MSERDPFGTAAVRERVLAAWAASPARFREDANAEEDFSLGGYRDRVIVELAQNAADAAAVAGEPGRLRLSLSTSDDGAVLAAANTGTPLDPAGVAALATLRASAKRGGSSVGRFGVGFAAVLSVTDEPILLSRSGSVRFSRADTAQLVADLDVPELADEMRRRDGHVPVLRLPFEAEGEPPHGYSTVVLLPLRDDAAADLSRRLLEAVDDALLLALPGLVEVEIQVDDQHRTLRDALSRWDVLARSGDFAAAETAELFADRPTEEAHRAWWSVLWALPRRPDLSVPQVIHAPTPTDEPLHWPALLLASLPLDPSRRHVAPGRLADRVVAEAATAYADLLSQRAADGMDVLSLVPTGLGAGAVDGALRLATLEALKTAPILRSAEDDHLLRPRDAVTVDGADPTSLPALAAYVAGLVDAPVSGRAPLRLLGVPQLGLSDVIEAMPYAEDPAGWAERYVALAGLAETPEGREALGVLPVPLADGRVVRGARGLLLPPAGMTGDAVEQLAAAGVRLVHPAALHPLLARLGAVEATPRELLEQGAVRELVETSPDADDPDEVAETVLGLVRAAVTEGGWEPGDLPWLSDLALPDLDGELAPAGALALPGSVASRVLDPDEIGVVPDSLVSRFGAEALCAAGVLDDLAVLRLDDVDLADPDESLLDLPGFTDWAEQWAGPDGAVAGEMRVLRDLDVVRPEAWAEALRAVAASPSGRAALINDVRLRDRHGRGRDVPSYTVWWLRRELSLDAHSDPSGDPALAALLDPAPSWVAELDHDVRRALGVVASVEDLSPPVTGLVLTRLTEPDRAVGLVGLLAVWGWLAAVSDQVDVAPPQRVRAWTATGVAVVDADHALVVDQPMWLQRNDFAAFVLAPAGMAGGLADLLDLDLASDRAAGAVTSSGRDEPVPPSVRGLVASVSDRWCRHDRLEVDGVSVSWWVDDVGRAHAAGPDGLARALAWASGSWSRRFALAAALADPTKTDALTLDAAFD